MNPRRAGLLLAALLAGACDGWVLPSEPGRDRLAIFDQVWSEFDRHYAFFELSGVDWSALGAAYRDSARAASGDHELAAVLGAMINRLGDRHSVLFTSYGPYMLPPLTCPHHFSWDSVRSTYLSTPPAATRSGRITYAWLAAAPGLGYIRMGSFEGSGWGGEIEDALAALNGARTLVVDVRDNGGGNEGNAQAIAARFADRTRPYKVAYYRNGPGHGDFAPPVTVSLEPAGQRRFTGPVVLLTNRYDGSAAEDFVLMMRVLPTITVVGDTTGGLGGNPLQRELPNGWYFRVSQSYQATPDGFVYQWRGLPPAVPVAWPADAPGDPYLDAAIARLR